jgi:hypothetical protein
MTKRNMTGFLLFMLIVSTAITISTWVQATNQGKRLERVERTLIDVQYPCTKGNDRNCQQFLDVLLSNATKKQLRQLLNAQKIQVSEADLNRFLQSLRTHPTSPFDAPKVTLPNGKRKGVRPGGNKPNGLHGRR